MNACTDGQAALGSMRQALGGANPTFLLAYTSAPPTLVQPMLEALAAAAASGSTGGTGSTGGSSRPAGLPPIPLVGCSSLRWQPEILKASRAPRGTGGAGSTGGAGGTDSASIGSSQRGSDEEVPVVPIRSSRSRAGRGSASKQYHVTVAGAHLPHLVAHAFHSPMVRSSSSNR